MKKILIIPPIIQIKLKKKKITVFLDLSYKYEMDTLNTTAGTAQKMKFFVQDFFSKRDQIRSEYYTKNEASH